MSAFKQLFQRIFFKLRIFSQPIFNQPKTMRKLMQLFLVLNFKQILITFSEACLKPTHFYKLSTKEYCKDLTIDQNFVLHRCTVAKYNTKGQHGALDCYILPYFYKIFVGYLPQILLQGETFLIILWFTNDITKL